MMNLKELTPPTGNPFSTQIGAYAPLRLAIARLREEVRDEVRGECVDDCCALAPHVPAFRLPDLMGMTLEIQAGTHGYDPAKYRELQFPHTFCVLMDDDDASDLHYATCKVLVPHPDYKRQHLKYVLMLPPKKVPKNWFKFVRPYVAQAKAMPDQEDPNVQLISAEFVFQILSIPPQILSMMKERGSMCSSRSVEL
jgi:hypothetical protein